MYLKNVFKLRLVSPYVFKKDINVLDNLFLCFLEIMGKEVEIGLSNDSQIIMKIYLDILKFTVKTVNDIIPSMNKYKRLIKDSNLPAEEKNELLLSIEISKKMQNYVWKIKNKIIYAFIYIGSGSTFFNVNVHN